jgi:hypothetical protein
MRGPCGFFRHERRIRKNLSFFQYVKYALESDAFPFDGRMNAINPANEFVIQSVNERCPEYSVRQMFFSSSLTVSVTERFPDNIFRGYSSADSFDYIINIDHIKDNHLLPYIILKTLKD